MMGVPGVKGQRSMAAQVVACVALFTDMLVYGLAIPVLPLLPATVRAGAAATGALFAAYAIAMVAATPVAGRLVDRAGPRQPLLVGLVGLAAATVLFALGGPFWLLVLARALQGLGAGMSWVAGLSLIAAVTPPEQLGKAMGTAMSMVSVGVLAGPPAAGALVAAFGSSSPFIVGAALALVDGVLRVVLVRSVPEASRDVAGPITILRLPGSLSVLVAVVVGAASLSAVEPVLPLRLAQTEHVGALGIGLLFAGAVLTGAVLNPLIGARLGRVDARWLIGVGILTASAAFIVLGFADVLWQTVAGMVLLGASNALLLAPATALIGQQGMRAAPPALGAAYAAFNLAYATGLFLGPLLGGGITGLVGFSVASIVLAALFAPALATMARLPTGLRRLSAARTMQDAAHQSPSAAPGRTRRQRPSGALHATPRHPHHDGSGLRGMDQRRDGHALPTQVRKPTEAEWIFFQLLAARIDGLQDWYYEDPGGRPWMTVSVDVSSHRQNHATWRLDFDGQHIAGGNSPACLNWDGGVRAESVDTMVTDPGGISALVSSPPEAALLGAEWFRQRLLAST